MSLLLQAGIVALALALGIGYKVYNPSVPDDNPIEELSELIIKQATDIDIDLTPHSKEEK